MAMTDEEISAWIKNLVFQNKRAKTILTKIIEMSDLCSNGDSETKFTIIGVDELNTLKTAQKRLFEIRELALNMIKVLSIRGNIEKKK